MTKWILRLTILIALALIALAITRLSTFTYTGYWIGGKKTKETVAPNLVNRVKKELFTVNWHFCDVDDEEYPFRTFQLKYPSKYLVTSDDMISDYKTEGGLAPPELTFTTKSQPLSLGRIASWDFIREEEDCILVGSTSGFDSIEDWQKNLARNTPQLISSQKLKIGKFNVDKRVVHYEGRKSSNVEAFIKLPKGISYYFKTCNMNSESDLNIMLENFDVRTYRLPSEHR